MDTETIAVIAAGLGVVGTVVFAALLGKGVRSLSQIRDALRRPTRSDD